jgi:MFS family permease
MALQFGPQVLLLPLTGFAADHLDRRKLLLGTQAAMAALALGLGILTVAGLAQLWHVLIATVGPGWVFLINAASFAAVIGSLSLLRIDELHRTNRAVRTRGSLIEGFRYIWKRPDLKAVLLMLFLIGTFGLNFPIFISTMSVTVFHAGASQYGLLTSIMASGSAAGALLAARREEPRIALLLAGAGIFGFGFALAAIIPNYWLFGLALIIIGVSAQTFTTTVNSAVQLSTETVMRERVMAILLAIALGGTPIGAPIVGWVADRFGPRSALGVGAPFPVLPQQSPGSITSRSTKSGSYDWT